MMPPSGLAGIDCDRTSSPPGLYASARSRTLSTSKRCARRSSVVQFQIGFALDFADCADKLAAISAVARLRTTLRFIPPPVGFLYGEGKIGKFPTLHQNI